MKLNKKEDLMRKRMRRAGPFSIVRVGGLPREWQADAEIDATGKYVMPGIINGHIHLQDERGGVPQPFQYEMNLYLAAGATTLRDVGAHWAKAKDLRAKSAGHP